jgi:5,10-methylenetetrahydromethanopterin reductase
MQTSKTLGPMRDAVEIVRGVLGGDAFEYSGSTWNASVPALQSRRTPSRRASRLRRATAPKMQALAGEIADGCLTPSITTPPFVRYTKENVRKDIDIGCTVVASIHESDRDEGRDGARDRRDVPREQSPEHPGVGRHAARARGDRAGRDPPVAEAMEQGGRLAAKAKVTDALLDKCKPIAGTPDDCIAAIEEYREAGCTHVMLELWGRTGTSRSVCSANRCCPTSVRHRPDARRGTITHPALHARRGGCRRRHPARRPALDR